jgi:NitT/TauT family transport system permease protein
MSRITLPASLPYIIAGIRLSAGMAIIGVILSEMFTAMTGLGYLLVNYANRFQTDRVFSVIIVIALLALIINGVIKKIETKVLHWKPATEERS